jgi:hypothetical protein
MNSIKISADEKRWRAESDLDSLKRAKEIMADKARLAAAQGIAKKQIAALGGIVKGNSKPSSSSVKRKK